MAARSWLKPLYSAEQMRALDSWAIETKGVPSLDLMERAGAEVVRTVTEMNPDGPVRVVCGKGNNGGDGLVVARLLRDAGLEAQALLLWPADQLSADAQTNHARLVESGGEAPVIAPSALGDALARSGLVVDALLGTGFSGAPREPVASAIEAINSARAAVVAIDVPSGVDASTGEVVGACVEARKTVSFQCQKIGLAVNPGKRHSGQVVVADIGIPVEEPDAPPLPETGLIRAAVLELPQQRGPQSTKFSSGTALVVGGSVGLTGAVCLCCEAAMRAGAGWVRAGVPASLNTIFEVKLTEVMTLPFSDGGGHFDVDALEQAIDATERADAVALGPGLGRTPDAFAVAQGLATRIDKPLLIDADALNAIAEAGIERLAGRSAPTVLTPHAGELGRLLKRESSEIEAHRWAAVREAAERSGAIVVLKGDDTLVAEPGTDTVAVSAGGSPGLATAGTGDVLSGVTVAMLARGLDPFAAACAAVRAHLGAGRIAAENRGPSSVIAGDVVEALPAALRGPA